VGESRHDRPVFVVDLRAAAMEESAAEVVDRRDEDGPRSLPEPPLLPIDQVALLVDGRDEPVLLSVEPTRDVELLDALARLLRIALLSGERVPAVAVEYGDELERRLAFERRLPAWVYDGVRPAVALRLPAALRSVLGPPRE